MAWNLIQTGALGVAMSSVAFILGCGQTSSDVEAEDSGGASATGGTSVTGGTSATAGAQTGAVTSVAGGAGGADVRGVETTFRIVNDTDATIYVQLPSRHTVDAIKVSGEYQGAHDMGDDVPFCMDCPHDTCPQWEPPPLTVEAIDPGGTWERVWDGYLYNYGDDFCVERKAWRGFTHTAEICWGTDIAREGDTIVGVICVHREFMLGDTVVQTVTN